jgi:hypothetical protein
VTSCSTAISKRELYFRQLKTTGHFPTIQRQARDEMPKYLIEREIPGAAKMSASDLRAISQRSCAVIRNLGPDVQWVESFVTDDKVYCIYIASDAEIIRKHAEQGGFPANRISEIKGIIDPATA